MATLLRQPSPFMLRGWVPLYSTECVMVEAKNHRTVSLASITKRSTTFTMALTDVAATTAHSGLLFFSIVCGKKGFSGVEGGWDGPNPFEA